MIPRTGNIFYNPKDGFRSKAGLNIDKNSLDQFEQSWNVSGDYGNFKINVINIGPGFEIWMADCMIEKDIRFLVDEYPEVFSFSFCLSGKSRSFYDSQKYPFEISSGNQGIFYSPDFKGYSTISADIPICQVGIAVSPDRLRSYFDTDMGSIHQDMRKILENKNKDPFYRIRTITPAMREALLQMLKCPFKGISRKLFLESRALELISYQLDYFSEAGLRHNEPGKPLHPNDRKQIETVRNYLSDNIEITPGLQDLARKAGMSSPKLNGCFRQMYGMTVFEFLRNERLLKAREMLMNGLNVTETAYAVGYESISHFSQAFKKQFGTSPSIFWSQS